MDLSEISTNPNRHPWEMSRADFLLEVLEKHLQLTAGSELLDVGAGDLFFSEKVHLATSVRIDAVDSAFDEEGPRNEAIQKIKHLHSVLHKHYDAICAMDVLEHVENHREFLNLLLHMLKPGAAMLLTMPAWNFLFSRHDHNLRHFRRYRLSQIEALIDPAVGEFEICEGFYFFHTLFLVRIFQKIFETLLDWIGFKNKTDPKTFKSINQWKYPEEHPITKSLGLVLGIDAYVCRALARIGLIIPGLSMCMVIRKKPG